MLSNRWNKTIYGLWAPIYDGMIAFHPVARARNLLLRQIAPLNPTMVVLAGVGTGADLPYVPEESTILGVDLSLPMLKLALRRATTLRRDFQPIRGDVANLPIADSCIDVVVLTLIVSVVPDAAQCLQEAVRITADEGRIVVLDKFLPADKTPSLPRRLLNLVTRPFGTDINRRWKDMQPPGVTVVKNQSLGWNGSIRMIVLQKNRTTKT